MILEKSIFLHLQFFFGQILHLQFDQQNLSDGEWEEEKFKNKKKKDGAGDD